MFCYSLSVLANMAIITCQFKAFESSEVADIGDKLGVQEGIFLAFVAGNESYDPDDHDHEEQGEEELNQVCSLLVGLQHVRALLLVQLNQCRSTLRLLETRGPV